MNHYLLRWEVIATATRRPRDRNCMLVVIYEETRIQPDEGESGGWFFVFFIRLSNASAAAAAYHMLILENVMVYLWHKTRNGACGEKRLASNMYLPVPVQTASSHTKRDIHSLWYYIDVRCFSAMVIWILFFNCVVIVSPLQVRVELLSGISVYKANIFCECCAKSEGAQVQSELLAVN